MPAIALSIDIGGTNTKFALITAEGRFLSRSAIHTPAAKDGEGYLRAVFEAIDSLLGALPPGHALAGIGIGAPGCNDEDGTIGYAVNLPFSASLPIVQIFRERYEMPVFLAKDANAAALGELHYGGGRGLHSFLLLTLGTGLGCGIVLNGGLVSGVAGMAGEFGHTTVVPAGRACGCGNQGCLETYVSATGIKRTAFELMATMREDSLLRDWSFHQLEPHDVHEAAQRGDVLALRAFEVTGALLGQKMAELALTLCPQAFFLSGGLVDAGDYLLRPTQESFERHLLPSMRSKIPIRISSLGAHDAALLGEASLVWAQALAGRL